MGLREGEVRRRTLLGSEATYRVIGTDPDGLVRVAVVEAPGLPSGHELRLRAEAVGAMELIEAAERLAPATRQRAVRLESSPGTS